LNDLPNQLRARGCRRWLERIGFHGKMSDRYVAGSSWANRRKQLAVKKRLSHNYSNALADRNSPLGEPRLQGRGLDE